MLYDPKWEQKTETKADPFSLAGLIAWLEKKPAEAEYSWFECERCMLGQYLRSIGRHPTNDLYDFPQRN